MDTQWTRIPSRTLTALASHTEEIDGEKFVITPSPFDQPEAMRAWSDSKGQLEIEFRYPGGVEKLSQERPTNDVQLFLGTNSKRLHKMRVDIRDLLERDPSITVEDLLALREYEQRHGQRTGLIDELRDVVANRISLAMDKLRDSAAIPAQSMNLEASRAILPSPSNLLTFYSKEIESSLGQTAVVPPGAPIKLGDIVSFPQGRGLGFIFTQVKPIGPFEIVTNLDSLGIDFQFSEAPSAALSFSSGGARTTYTGTSLSIEFSAPGIYLATAQCKERHIVGAAEVIKQLAPSRGTSFLMDTFLVVSVTVADRALLAVSTSRSGVLKTEGAVKPNSGQLDPSVALVVTRSSNMALVVPWLEQVTLFMKLERL